MFGSPEAAQDATVDAIEFLKDETSEGSGEAVDEIVPDVTETTLEEIDAEWERLLEMSDFGSLDLGLFFVPTDVINKFCPTPGES